MCLKVLTAAKEIKVQIIKEIRSTMIEVESNRDEWIGSIVSLAASLQIKVTWHGEQITISYRLNWIFYD